MLGLKVVADEVLHIGQQVTAWSRSKERYLRRELLNAAGDLGRRGVERGAARVVLQRGKRPQRVGNFLAGVLVQHARRAPRGRVQHAVARVVRQLGVGPQAVADGLQSGAGRASGAVSDPTWCTGTSASPLAELTEVLVPQGVEQIQHAKSYTACCDWRVISMPLLQCWQLKSVCMSSTTANSTLHCKTACHRTDSNG